MKLSTKRILLHTISKHTHKYSDLTKQSLFLFKY